MIGYSMFEPLPQEKHNLLSIKKTLFNRNIKLTRLLFWGADLDSLSAYKPPSTDTSLHVLGFELLVNPSTGCIIRMPFVVRPSISPSLYHLVAFSCHKKTITTVTDTGNPVKNTIIILMVYKCQHGLCPSYLAEDSILLSATHGRQHLRLAGRLELLVPGTQTVTFGPRAFTVAGPGFGILYLLL